MAVLKYKKKDGSYATLTNISVKGVDPVQTTGTSLTDIMSQNAVTVELAEKLAVSDFNTYSGAVDTSISEKASQSDLNTLSGTVTAHTADATIHVTSSDKEKWDNVDNKVDTSAYTAYTSATETTIGNKVDKVEGKALSTNDFTTAYKDKLDGIASGANVNVQADWSETATTADSYIQNKPTLGTAAAKDVSSGIANNSNLIESNYIYSGVGVTISYDSESKYIELKSTSGNVLSSFNASEFIVDGMVDNVEIKSVAGSGTCLVVSFNTDAGKQDINIPISQIFDANNYYTKTEVDDAISAATSGDTVGKIVSSNNSLSISTAITEDNRISANVETNASKISGLTAVSSADEGAAKISGVSETDSVKKGIENLYKSISSEVAARKAAILARTTTSGNKAIAVTETPNSDGFSTTITLTLDVTTDGTGMEKTGVDNALSITNNGLYLSTDWTCGDF